MPVEFTAVLVKGRGNYLSLRRMESAAARAASLFHREEDFAELRSIVDWSRRTTDGSLADLDHRPLPAVWDEVESDSGNCLGRKCPTYKECFYYQARRRVQHAQLLVVNHALFFSDLALRREGASILPDYDAVIFDEAHTLGSGGRRPPGRQRDQWPGRLPAEQVVQRSDESRAVGPSPAGAGPEGSAALPPAGGRILRRRSTPGSSRSGKTSLRVAAPEIVANRLSPALAHLAGMLRSEALRAAGERAAGFDLGRRPAEGLGPGDRTTGGCSRRRAWSIGSTRRRAVADGCG